MEDDNFLEKLLALAWGLVLCAAIWLLCGCAARKPLILTVTDTVRVEHNIRDTVWRDRVVTKTVTSETRESKTRWDSTSTVVDEQGNVKRTDSWHRESTDRDSRLVEQMRDSLGIYKAKVDSLEALNSKRQDVPVYVPVERKATWWERNMERPFTHLMFFASGIVVLLIVWWLVKRKRGER